MSFRYNAMSGNTPSVKYRYRWIKDRRHLKIPCEHNSTSATNLEKVADIELRKDGEACWLGQSSPKGR